MKRTESAIKKEISYVADKKAYLDAQIEVLKKQGENLNEKLVSLWEMGNKVNKRLVELNLQLKDAYKKDDSVHIESPFSNGDIPKLTKEQATILSAYTGVLCGSWSDMQAYAESLLGRPIMSHEFASKHILSELRLRSYDDFVKLCFKEDDPSL